MGYSNSGFKRLVDLALGAVAAVIVSPFLLISIIAIKLETKGPAFFLQARSSRGDGLFKVYKLRTMVKDAPKVGPALTQAADPRITRVGKFLRRTSIDELPQVFNVLKGDMSLVGPRPEIPSITSTYSPELKKVLDYKPGITGISQISGRAALEIDPKIRMEIAYQEKATFWSDFMIMVKTPKALLTNEGNVM